MTQKQINQTRKEIKTFLKKSDIFYNIPRVQYLKKRGYWKMNKYTKEINKKKENVIIEDLEHNLPKNLDNKILLHFHNKDIKYSNQVFLRYKKKKKLQKHFKKLPTDLQNIIKKDYLYDLLNIKYEELENDIEYLSNEWNSEDVLINRALELEEEFNKLNNDFIILDDILRNY